jgi:lipopolysaccharide biosynthesis glycosyltransferase
MESYAKKIGAEFLRIKEVQTANLSPHFAKFEIFDLLNRYDRIVYIDGDCLVRSDMPNLFELVPVESFGALDESPYNSNRPQSMKNAAISYGIGLNDEILKKYTGYYFNTGVMAVSKQHQSVFERPIKQYDLEFQEQSLINARVVSMGIPTYSLDYRFNRMTCLDHFASENKYGSYVIHYAGCTLPESPFVDVILKDISVWKKSGRLE